MENNKVTRKTSVNNEASTNDTNGNPGSNDSANGPTDSDALDESGFNAWRSDVSDKLSKIYDHLFPENDGTSELESDGDTGADSDTSDGPSESPKTLSFWERNKRYFLS
jgi:hypothetical protein